MDTTIMQSYGHTRELIIGGFQNADQWFLLMLSKFLSSSTFCKEFWTNFYNFANMFLFVVSLCALDLVQTLVQNLYHPHDQLVLHWFSLVTAFSHLCCWNLPQSTSPSPLFPPSHLPTESHKDHFKKKWGLGAFMLK